MIAILNSTLNQYPPTQNKVTMLNEFFTGTETPEGWVVDGGTVNNGVEFTGGHTSLNKKVYYNNYSFLDRCTVRAEFVVSDLTSEFGVGKNLANRGNIVKVDMGANTLELGILATANTEPSPYEFSTAFTLTKTLNDTYVVEFTIDRYFMIAKVYNKDAPNVFNQIIRNYNIDDTFAGSAWGEPTAYHFSGTTKVTSLKYIALCKKQPKIMFIGDSNTEGFNVITETGNLTTTHCDLVRQDNALNEVIVSGRGGQNISLALDYIDFEFTHIKPIYTVVMLGTNDTTHDATWESNYTDLMNRIVANGSTPVPCTLPPRPSSQTAINSHNTFIKGLSYDYINVAAAVSDSNDEVTWNTAYRFGDLVHLNVAGYQAVYNWIAANNSYLIG